jgi:uncharacterized protein (DUF58 family)
MPVLDSIRRRISRPPTPPAPVPEELFDEAFLRKLEYLHLVSKKIFSGHVRAERRTKKVGSGVEFADYRDYSPGDDLRYLDWNIYGRLERLLLRLFEEEEDLHIYVLLDVSQSMAFGNPVNLHYGMQVAAALAYVGLANLDRVSILAVADKIVARLAPARGKGRIFHVFEFLRNLQPQRETDLAAACRTFVAQNKRRGIAILVSDLYDPGGFEGGINALRFGRFETGVIQVFDHSEVNPKLHGDLSLVDVETGETREVTITPRILKRYAEVHKQYRAQIEQFCREKQVAHFEVNTGVPFDELVLRVLRRGGLLR